MPEKKKKQIMVQPCLGTSLHICTRIHPVMKLPYCNLRVDYKQVN